MLSCKTSSSDSEDKFVSVNPYMYITEIQDVEYLIDPNFPVVQNRHATLGAVDGAWRFGLNPQITKAARHLAGEGKHKVRYTMQVGMEEEHAAIGFPRDLSPEGSLSFAQKHPKCFQGLDLREVKKSSKGHWPRLIWKKFYNEASCKASEDKIYFASYKATTVQKIPRNDLVAADLLKMKRDGVIRFTYFFYDLQYKDGGKLTGQLEYHYKFAIYLFHKHLAEMSRNAGRSKLRFFKSSEKDQKLVVKNFSGDSDLEIRFIRKEYTDKKQNLDTREVIGLIEQSDYFAYNGHAYDGDLEVFEAVKKYTSSTNEYRILHLNSCFSTLYTDLQLVKNQGQKQSYDFIGHQDTIVFSAIPIINLAFLKGILGGKSYLDILMDVDKALKTDTTEVYSKQRDHVLRNNRNILPDTLVFERTQ